MAESYFKKSFKGYDPQQVDDFIVGLSDRYESNQKALGEQLRDAENECEKLRCELARLRTEEEANARAHEAALAEKQKEYDALCAEIGEKMVVADKRAAEITKTAEKEAALILTRAKTDAENEAKAIRARAEDEANRLVEETRRKCDEISAAAEEFRIRQNEMNRSISETEKQFGNALNKLREGIGN
ncbi:MAG: hypothetical protein IJO64_07415 [Clostridia bacterium]|nr:hypothetical protein [Clostridia bacterium]